MNWWNKGPLYQISNVKDFSDQGLKVEEKLDYLNQLKVKGLVLGPIHTVQADQLSSLNLTAIESEVGTENELKSLVDQAHKKVLNLTPNYEGPSAWFSNASTVAEKLKTSMGWSLNRGTLGTPESTKLFHDLLFTLPGTPGLNAGDEMALKAGEKPTEMWDLESQAERANATTMAGQEDCITARDFFKAFGDLRKNELALLHGEIINLNSSDSSLAFLHLWDQSERFITSHKLGKLHCSLDAH
ncbi:4F2 cell-surface antigen heavy chain-like isoform X1 [Triplophysa dalaica]|uniref:4F2 cell-surface antigen heavy chain-like isoform X1 n=1 Tax=Triplophysa dalaica TaxID=1582913 RepID=UPI0024E03E40|nr:4F2 cell-surface antigen heavy chain-like isoform X1 [Triplophysa dalaica]